MTFVESPFFTSLLGALIGAASAVGAVFLGAYWQRRQEGRNTRSAILREVTEFSRFVVFNLETCLEITRGMEISASRLLITTELPDPIIYRAVADRLSVTETPQQIVSFYARLSEAKNTVISMGDFSTDMIVRPDSELTLLAETWLEALELAKDILIKNSDGKVSDEEPQRKVRASIDYTLEWGRNSF